MGMLKPFAVSEIRSLKKGKTLKYFGVSISMRKMPDKAEIDDESAAIAYCEQHIPEAVETKKTLSRVLVKKALVDGCFIPGADLVHGSEELYITGDKEHANQTKAVAA
jgi:phage host-nuclease inhibitor protein Gam